MLRAADWILPDLPIATKLMLRTEMALPVSDKDEEGYVSRSSCSDLLLIRLFVHSYIYVHEMVEKKSSSSSYSSRTFSPPSPHITPANQTLLHPSHRINHHNTKNNLPKTRSIHQTRFPSLTMAFPMSLSRAHRSSNLSLLLLVVDHPRRNQRLT